MSSSPPSSAPPGDIEAPLLDKSDYGATSTPQKRSKGAPAAPDRFWTDIAICCGSLVLIIAVFFGTIAVMNYEYKQTTFDLHTECVPAAVRESMLKSGLDFSSHTIKAAYVVPKGEDPIKMAPVPGKPGQYHLKTWMGNDEWGFALATEEGGETLYPEVGTKAHSPLAFDTHDHCVSKLESTGEYVREIGEEGLVAGAEVSHVFGSCDYSCDRKNPPPEDEAAGTTTAARSTSEWSHPVYPGAPSTQAYLQTPVDDSGFMVLPDGVSSGILLSDGTEEEEVNRPEPGYHAARA